MSFLALIRTLILLIVEAILLALALTRLVIPYLDSFGPSHTQTPFDWNVLTWFFCLGFCAFLIAVNILGYLHPEWEQEQS